MTSFTKYLRNVWYQAGWSDEVPEGGKIARTIAEESILFFRTGDGTLEAIGNRCPHRFAPLERGFVAHRQCGRTGKAQACEVYRG